MLGSSFVRIISKTVLLCFVLFSLSSCGKTKVKVETVGVSDIKQQFIELARTHIDKSYIVTMPFTGKLIADRNSSSVQPGSHVDKGAVLARMSDNKILLQIEHAQKVLASSTASLQAARHEATIYKNQLTRYQSDNMKKTLSKAQFEKLELTELKSQSLVNKSIESNDAAQKQVDLLLYQKQKCLLKSPADGVVLNVYQHGGGTLNVGTPVFEIGDVNQMTIEADVLSDRVHQMHVGQIVSIGLSRAGFSFQGKIARINPAGFMERSPLGVKERRVPVLIDLITRDNFPKVLGSRLYVQFTVSSYHGLVLPHTAVLRSHQGSYYVFKVVDGVLKQQAVTIGIDDDSHVAITQGLTDQDKVVLSPTYNMKDGESVSVESSKG
jgi:HlyD family secretion protein